MSLVPNIQVDEGLKIPGLGQPASSTRTLEHLNIYCLAFAPRQYFKGDWHGLSTVFG